MRTIVRPTVGAAVGTIVGANLGRPPSLADLRPARGDAWPALACTSQSFAEALPPGREVAWQGANKWTVDSNFLGGSRGTPGCVHGSTGDQ